MKHSKRTSFPHIPGKFQRFPLCYLDLDLSQSVVRKQSKIDQSLPLWEITFKLDILKFRSEYRAEISRRVLLRMLSITIIPYRMPVAGFIKCVYHGYFGIKLGDQDKLGRHTWCAKHAPRLCVEINITQKPDLMDRHGCHFLTQQCKNTLNEW